MPNIGITMGTLVHMAKQAGWRPMPTEREVIDTSLIDGFLQKAIGNIKPEKGLRLSTGYDADQLQQLVFPKINFTVEGYIPEGLTILAGRPKIGKSWACMDIAIAVATGSLPVPMLLVSDSCYRVAYRLFQ